MAKQKKLSCAEHHAIRMKRISIRWPAWVALLIVSLLYEALPQIFYWGPRGLLIGLVVILIVSMVVAIWHSNVLISRYLGLTVNVLITTYMIISVIRLVIAALEGSIGPQHLLTSAIVLWATNILIFALWYWNLDAGGPAKRESIDGTHLTAFVFPQAQISLLGSNSLPSRIKDWEPQFIDYLFLSFNTSTAFSPTDTPVLSRWAKCISMMQAIISLTIIVMLAARAVNILNPATNYLVS